jgi:hypothetical protein
MQLLVTRMIASKGGGVVVMVSVEVVWWHFTSCTDWCRLLRVQGYFCRRTEAHSACLQRVVGGAKAIAAEGGGPLAYVGQVAVAVWQL